MAGAYYLHPDGEYPRATPAPSSEDKKYVGGLPFISTTPENAATTIVEWCRQAAPVHVHLANAFTISLSDVDAEYRMVLKDGEIFPDGRPISWASALFGHTPRLQQTRGPQLFLDVLDRGREFGLTHFLLGSSESTLQALTSELEKRFPGVCIAGQYSPPFRKLTVDEFVAQDAKIRSSGAEVVWVGLGTPKQDREAARLSKSVGIPAVAVGAAFDYAAGTLTPAPRWVRNAGLEWLHRLASEPRRLWRRYLFGNIRFIRCVLREQRAYRRRNSPA